MLLTPDTHVNLLVAYPYFIGGMGDAVRRLADTANVRLLIDSGAYTAWNSKKTIDLAAYCRFLANPPVPYTFAVQLDVFGDAEGSYRNLTEMHRRGFHNVLPVFTRGETLERLEEFYTYSDYIMFGGVTIGENNRAYINWFQEQNQGRKAHWLGFTEMDYLKHHRPESADSSGWHCQATYGLLNIYDGNGMWKRVHKSNFGKLLANKRWLRMNRISGPEIEALSDPAQWKNGPRAMSLNITARAHLLRAIDVERSIGTKLYLACSTPFQVDAITYAWKSLL